MILCTRSNKKAFALSIVLWIVAALLFGIATLSVLSKDTFSLTKGVNSKLKTQLMAEDVLEALKFYVITADYTHRSLINNNLSDFDYIFPNEMILDNRWYKVGENIQIRIMDTSAMLNILKTSPQTIGTLSTTEHNRQKRYVINDSITDWKDKDNSVSLNGAEESRYRAIKGVKYKIRNSAAIQHVQELKLINGIDSMDEDEWQNLKNRLYYGNGNVANLTLADSKYMAYLLGINESEAEALADSREVDLEKFVKF